MVTDLSSCIDVDDPNPGNRSLDVVESLVVPGERGGTAQADEYILTVRRDIHEIERRILVRLRRQLNRPWPFPADPSIVDRAGRSIWPTPIEEGSTYRAHRHRRTTAEPASRRRS
jgi:hypothetical protein